MYSGLILLFHQVHLQFDFLPQELVGLVDLLLDVVLREMQFLVQVSLDLVVQRLFEQLCVAHVFFAGVEVSAYVLFSKPVHQTFVNHEIAIFGADLSFFWKGFIELTQDGVVLHLDVLAGCLLLDEDVRVCVHDFVVEGCALLALWQFILLLLKFLQGLPDAVEWFVL